MAQKSAGFTLIEMLLTIAILSLLAGLVLGYSRSAENTNTLKRMADKLASDLRQCQSLALSSEGGVGWGISVNSPTSYQIFKDSNNNHYFDERDTVVSTETLKTGVQFENSNISILFSAPLGEVYVNGLKNQTASFVLTLTNYSDRKRYITVTSFGSIAIDSTPPESLPPSHPIPPPSNPPSPPLPQYWACTDTGCRQSTTGYQDEITCQRFCISTLRWKCISNPDGSKSCVSTEERFSDSYPNKEACEEGCGIR